MHSFRYQHQLSLVGLLLLLTGCPKEEYPVVLPIIFLPDVTISPTSRTIRRNDTLWLEANFSDSLLDKTSGRRFRVRPQDLALNSAIIYQELLGVGQLSAPIAGTFHLVEKIGRAQIQGASSSSFIPEYDGHFYRARIGLIPTKAGITAISMLIIASNPATGKKSEGYFLPFINLPRDAEGREQKAALEAAFYSINGGKANNFDLYSQHTQTFVPQPGVSPFQTIYEQQSTFTVEVK